MRSVVPPLWLSRESWGSTGLSAHLLTDLRAQRQSPLPGHRGVRSPWDPPRLPVAILRPGANEELGRPLAQVAPCYEAQDKTLQSPCPAPSCACSGGADAAHPLARSGPGSEAVAQDQPGRSLQLQSHVGWRTPSPCPGRAKAVPDGGGVSWGWQKTESCSALQERWLGPADRHDSPCLWPRGRVRPATGPQTHIQGKRAGWTRVTRELRGVPCPH